VRMAGKERSEALELGCPARHLAGRGVKEHVDDRVYRGHDLEVPERLAPRSVAVPDGEAAVLAFHAPGSSVTVSTEAGATSR
jgi:hypothetical protein